MTGPVKDRPIHLAQPDSAHVDELVARAKQGDRGAFDVLVECYAPQVYNLAARITGSREEAEDCVQETFVRAFCSLSGFRGEAAFSTWLYRVALNVSTDAARKRSRAPAPVSSLPAADSESDTPDLDLLARREAAQTPEPEAALIAHQRRQLLLHAIALLPEHHRTVVVLYDLQGLSYEEIAHITKARVGTVKSRLNRARLSLKDLLAAHMELLQD